MTSPYYLHSDSRTFEKHRRERIREILAREPKLEAWQIAERFGLTERQASEVISDELRRWRCGPRGHRRQAARER